MVAQTAPQSFDISLWQLLAAVLAGGRTLVVDQETILDAGRFVDTIVERGVTVVLCALVPRDTGGLSGPHAPRAARSSLRVGDRRGAEKGAGAAMVRRSARDQVGECLRPYRDLRRHEPRNHRSRARPGSRPARPADPERPRSTSSTASCPLVPLGAPGEIVFSGICVGRGYIGDPERSRRAFIADPHRPHQRLYRGGDYGRWLADGRLTFGRRDTRRGQGLPDRSGEIENIAAPRAWNPRRRCRGHGGHRWQCASWRSMPANSRSIAARCGAPSAGGSRIHDPVGFSLASTASP